MNIIIVIIIIIITFVIIIVFPLSILTLIVTRRECASVERQYGHGPIVSYRRVRIFVDGPSCKHTRMYVFTGMHQKKCIHSERECASYTQCSITLGTHMVYALGTGCQTFCTQCFSGPVSITRQSIISLILLTILHNHVLFSVTKSASAVRVLYSLATVNFF